MTGITGNIASLQSGNHSKKHSFVFGVLLLYLIIFSQIFIAGCSRYKSINTNPVRLEDLETLSASNFAKTHAGAIRVQVLRDTALSVGARGGLAWRAAEINKVLTYNEKKLFRLFNFNAMMLDKNVLPPVLLEGRNTLTLGGTDTIRIADRNFIILTQAKFVTAPPIWRDYLWMCHTAPDTPDRSLLPRTQEERGVWRRYIDEGWQAGIQQADLIFKENLGRLKRDFEGMIRYRTLLAQRMVSPPFVAEMDMGVTGGGNDLTVHDRVLRITAFPALQASSENWKTEIIPYE